LPAARAGLASETTSCARSRFNIAWLTWVFIVDSRTCSWPEISALELVGDQGDHFPLAGVGSPIPAIWRSSSRGGRAGY